MSATTKILIVILAVFSIAFSMTAISFTAQTHDWRNLAEGYRTEALIANAHQRNLMASHAAELASARDTINSQTSRIGDLETKLQEASAGLAQRDGEIASLMGDKRRADALAQRLTNELGIAQAGRVEVEKQRQAFETRSIDLEKRNVDLNERVNELTTQVTVQLQQQRQQAQQVNILREENQKLALQAGAPVSALADIPLVGTGSLVTAATPPSATPVAGHVVAVDGELVTVSLGTSDNVKVGAIFVIYRGNQYVGDLEITDAEPNLSAGRLLRTQPGVTPQKGDRVQDEFSLRTP